MRTDLSEYLAGIDFWSLLDWLQLILDVAGIVFEPADLINVVISLLRGDGTGAALSAVALVPVAGIGTVAAKQRVTRLARDLPPIRWLLNKNSAIRSVRDGHKLAAMDEAVGYVRLPNNWFRGTTGTDYHFVYETDGFGRTASVRGVLRLDNYAPAPPNRVRQTMHAIGDTDDEAGHLIGRQFGGSGQPYNMIPQDGYVNRSLMKRYENAWRNLVKKGHTVEVFISPTYRVGSARPKEFTITWKLDGRPQGLTHFPNSRAARSVSLPPIILTNQDGAVSTDHEAGDGGVAPDANAAPANDRSIRISWGTDASNRSACPSGAQCRNLHYEYHGNWGPPPYTLECWSGGHRGWKGRWSGRPHTGCYYWDGSAHVVIDGIQSNTISLPATTQVHPGPTEETVTPEPAPANDRSIRISWGTDASNRSACPSGAQCRNLHYEYHGNWGPPPYTLECWSGGHRGWKGRWSGRPHTGCYYWDGSAHVIIDGIQSNTIHF